MKFFNLLQRFISFLFPEVYKSHTKEHAYIDGEEYKPKLIFAKSDPERWVRTTDSETGLITYSYTYTEAEAQALTINQIICELYKQESLVVSNFVDEEAFERIVYLLNGGLGEDVLLQKKKLKSKDFEVWLLEKIQQLSTRLEITRSLYVS